MEELGAPQLVRGISVLFSLDTDNGMATMISNMTLISNMISNALCCYPNVNGAIRNLSLNTPTATIFLQFNYFRENIWVRIWVQFHFLYIFVG